MLGFLIGFLSADQPQVGYLHFVGVDPAQRRNGLARRLCGEFFEAISFAGRTEVHAIASPENTGSDRIPSTHGLPRPGR
ncbi:GNAT family N-acetyltransferase [Saccharopolyspora sp. NPDC049357]|uniref:GNAT family N-acetyltransferase n=1 Tax=Saccharopolyspora sp. NPDC049357 TaxID=3154507 RepID=UPI00341F4E5A